MNNKQKWEQELISDIDRYGIYLQGLSTQEIKYYLKIRARNTRFSKQSVNKLYTAFCVVAGVNTAAIVTLEDGSEISLMYRWDVERYVLKLLEGTETYWD